MKLIVWIFGQTTLRLTVNISQQHISLSFQRSFRYIVLRFIVPQTTGLILKFKEKKIPKARLSALIETKFKHISQPPIIVHTTDEIRRNINNKLSGLL